MMPGKPIDLADRDVMFICGLHRSGTSLLHALLCAHPEISGFVNTGVPKDEGQHLQSVYSPAKTYGGPGRFGFDPHAYMDENHPLATRANAAILASEWGRYWDLGKPVLVEKSPPNLIRTRFLQALFPNSRFVVLFRHPIAVAYATRKWCDSTIFVLIDHTLLCYERAIADMEALNRVHVVRYEELVAAPQPAINRILQFANLGAHTVETVVIPALNGRYFDKWATQSEGIIKRAEIARPGWLARTTARCQALGYRLNSPEYFADQSDWR